MCRQAGDSHFLTTWIRKHGLATFVHERLECSLVDQSPEQSETEWMCIDVAGCKIINVYKPPRSRLAPIRPSRHFHIHTPVCNWWFQLPTWQLGYSKTSPNGESLNLRETANTLGLLYDAKRVSVSPLTDGTCIPTVTWPSWVTTRTTECLTDVYWKSSSGSNTDHLYHSKFLPSAIQLSVEVSKGWLEALLPSYSRIRWETSTSCTINIERTYKEICKILLFTDKQLHPTWSSQDLCAILGRVRDPLSLLPPRPSGDWFW